LLSLYLLVAISGCNAPHDNLFDPKNSNYVPPPAPGISISPTAHSLYQANWIPPDLLELDVSAVISNVNNVDAVWVTIDTMQLGSLSQVNNSSTWIGQFPQSYLPGGSLTRLVGHPLIIYCSTPNSDPQKSDPFTFVRVIQPVPTIISPAFDTLVGTQPRLTWLSYDAEYDFTYSVEIVHISTGYTPTLVFQRNGINPDSTGVTVDTPLPAVPRFLYWTISVVDEFGNKATSFEATFRVNDGAARRSSAGASWRNRSRQASAAAA
jgi:hypothetical protein